MDDLFYSIKAENSGISLSKIAEQGRINKKLQYEYGKYIDKRVSEWPKLNFNWDVSYEGQYYSSGMSNIDEFRRAFPWGYDIGDVDTSELNNLLQLHCKIHDCSKVWSDFRSNSLVQIIANFAEGYKLSPPLIAPSVSAGMINVKDGRHRYVIAKLCGEKQIPICCSPEDVRQLSSLVRVHWRTR